MLPALFKEPEILPLPDLCVGVDFLFADGLLGAVSVPLPDLLDACFAWCLCPFVSPAFTFFVPLFTVILAREVTFLVPDFLDLTLTEPLPLRA